MKKLLLSLVLTGFLAGCAATQPIKAPCNWSGNNCWPRTKINQWDNA